MTDRDHRDNLKSVKFSIWPLTRFTSSSPPARPLEDSHFLAPASH